MYRVGFIIGKREHDLIPKRLNRMYNRLYKIPNKYKFNYKDGSGTKGTPIDVLIAYYLKNNFEELFEIDIIREEDISLKRLSKNKINFLLGFDITSAKHSGYEKRHIERLKNIFKNPKSNIFPKWKDHEFIFDKRKYLSYLQQHKIPLVPTLFENKINKDNINRVINKIESNNWNKIIIKPSLYAESGYGIKIKSIDKIKNNKELYANENVLIQPFIEEFKTNWEIRVFVFNVNNKHYITHYIGNKSHVIAHGQSTLELPKKSVEEVLKLVEKIIKIYPKFSFNGKQVLPAVIRMDFGCCLNGKYFLNELENSVADYFSEKLKFDLVPVLGDLFALKAIELLE